MKKINGNLMDRSKDRETVRLRAAKQYALPSSKGGGGITINSGVQPKAMWVAKSLSPVMAAPNTLQIGLRCVFSICFFLSSFFTKYLWKAMEIPYNFSYKSYQLRNMWFFKMLNCRIHFIHHHVYCLKLQIDSKTKTRKWHDTDIKKTHLDMFMALNIE